MGRLTAALVAALAASALTPLAFAEDQGNDATDARRGQVQAAAASSPGQLEVKTTEGATADGRSIILFDITAAPPARIGELGALPELPSAECEGAASLAPVDGRAAVLAPGAGKALALSCKVSFRGAVAPVTVKLGGPRNGLVVRATPPWAKAGEGAIALAVGPDVVRDGSNLRASASAGTLSGTGGHRDLTLPPDRKPRMIAVAMTDGVRAGATFVPVWGHTELPVKADNGAEVRLRIGGRWYGPGIVRGGQVKVPILVQPGVGQVVVRATDSKGYALETSADLHPPDFDRLAAVGASDQVQIGGASFVVVALASGNAHPADQSSRVVATAARGRTGTPEFLGPGLWRVQYTAPAEVGADQIVVSVEGDRTAGTAEVGFDIVAGKAERIAVEIAPGHHRPGDMVLGRVTVLDAQGNPLHRPAVSAKLSGVPLAIETVAGALEVRIPIPERLPAALVLQVSAGGVDTETVIATQAATAVSARVHAQLDGRRARLKVSAKDRFGNGVAAERIAVEFRGAIASIGVPSALAATFTATAETGRRSATVQVTVDGQMLAEREIVFDPPSGTLLVGVYANGGWLSNQGAIQTPRYGAGVGLRRAGEQVEFALLAGVDRLSSTDTVEVPVGGTMEEIERSVSVLAVPVTARIRMRLAQRFGVSFGGGLVTTRASLRIAPRFQREDVYSEIALGARAQLAFDVAIGPGRLNLGASWGKAELSEGLVRGNLDGVSAFGSYEWWFADFGN